MPSTGFSPQMRTILSRFFSDEEKLALMAMFQAVTGYEAPSED